MTTRPTTTCSRGDVVLVPFAFTDESMAKRRPALVISAARFDAARQVVIIAAITSRMRQPPLYGDHIIKSWRAGGLLKPSIATAIVRTVKRSMIGRRLGALNEDDMRGVDGRLAQALDLSRQMRAGGKNG